MLTSNAPVSIASTRTARTQLLVSVRTLEEAHEAVAGGTDIVDIKEPARGPLGMADPRVWEPIAAAFTDRCMVTAAAGELIDYFDNPQAMDLLAKLNQRMALTKLGTSGLMRWPEWQQKFADLRTVLPCPARLVLVGYADDGTGSPGFGALVATTISFGGRVAMLDTFDKAGAGLMELRSREQLMQVIAQARDANLCVALAGRLTGQQATEASLLGASVVGVRGAACEESDRNAEISRDRVRELKQALKNSTRR